MDYEIIVLIIYLIITVGESFFAFRMYKFLKNWKLKYVQICLENYNLHKEIKILKAQLKEKFDNNG